jgi:hypothetical protein
LVKQGVPWDIAVRLDAVERTGWLVILGRAESNQEFDWDELRWKDR